MALDAGVTKLIRGDTATLEMVASLGGGFNFAGMTVRFTAKFDPGDSMEDAVIALEGPSPDVELEPEGAPEGTIRVNLLPEHTQVLPMRPIYLTWDCELNDAVGNSFTVAYGVLDVRPDVSA